MARSRPQPVGRHRTQARCGGVRRRDATPQADGEIAPFDGDKITLADFAREE